LKPIFGESGAMRFARDLPKLITFEPPPCTWFIRKIQKPIRSRNGRKLPISAIHENPPVPFESHRMPFSWSKSWKLNCAWSDA
jgi:hypothetical protein